MKKLILWGLNDNCGPVPIKLCEHSKSEQNFREKHGWILECVEFPKRPVYLDALVRAKQQVEKRAP